MVIKVRSSYTIIKEREEQVFMGDSKLSPKCGKEKVLLKLTLRKVSTVSDVLHMLYIH